MVGKDYDFDTFSKDMDKASNNINLKQATGSERKGKSRLRDRIVFGKMSWGEAQAWIAWVQSIVIFTALIPTSVITVNGFLSWVGIPWQFPLELSSVSAVFIIFFLFLFGLIAVRHIGTAKRSNEISSKMNPGVFILWEKLERIEKRLDEIEKSKKGKKGD